MITINKNIYVIAEAGVNFNGSFDLAMQLIQVAFEAGANAVKFQTFKADKIAVPEAQLADYQENNLDIKSSQKEMLKKLELPEAWHLELQNYAHKLGIDFFSTSFDIESTEFLKSIGQQIWKIPSGEITNVPYLRNIGKFNEDTILSTGMATIDEILFAIDILKKAGLEQRKLSILHCTTEYPAPFDEINLLAMDTIAKVTGLTVGYSDHSQGISVPLAAAARGAKIIEKHFTLNRNLPGPDHKASLEPHELKLMVEGIREIERALGSPIKAPTPSETKNINVARKSIVVAKKIKKGELFSIENITCKRPGTGLSPIYWDQIIGKVSPRDYDIDEVLDHYL